MTPTPVPDDRADRVRAYYGSLPLAAVADAMVAEADRAGIDWRLPVVIGMLESTGGKFACGFNAWGYASCAVSFVSFEMGVRTVAETLAESPYAGQSIPRQLCFWNSGGASWCEPYVAQAIVELGKLGPR